MFNCATGTIGPYVPSSTQPFDEQRARHLLRRAAYGANATRVQEVLTAGPEATIDELLNEAIGAPLMTAPYWADWTIEDYDDFNAQRGIQYWHMVRAFVQDMHEHPLRARMTLFWHDHFVTEERVYDCGPYMFEYYRTLQQYALGNFKEFVHDIGLTRAMLVYLNGAENTKVAPNENYARELYELFTLGADNGYTQEDIVETARALTGHTGYQTFCGDIGFNPYDWDPGLKTIFGQTYGFDYTGVIDNLFEQRAPQIATFICGKLYRLFVHPEPEADIIAELAQTLLDHDWEIAPVVGQLLRSEHFFDEANFNAQIKSPYDLCIELSTVLDLNGGDDEYRNIYWATEFLGQTLWNPPNVAGWPGNRAWINTSTLSGRWEVVSWLMWTNKAQTDAPYFRTFVQELMNDPMASDPALITRTLVDHLIPGGLQNDIHYERATIVFKADVPQNYYDNNQWNMTWPSAHWQVYGLLEHIGTLPEFQRY